MNLLIKLKKYNGEYTKHVVYLMHIATLWQPTEAYDDIIAFYRL